MSRARRWPLLATVAVVLWAALVGVWAARPFTEHLPLIDRATGAVAVDPVSGKAVPPLSVRCPAPFAGGDPPALLIGELARPEREPCARTAAQRRRLTMVDGAVAVLILAGVAVTARRRQAREAREAREADATS